MKIAIIGSRNLKVENLEKYLPEDTDEIVSGGARGTYTCAKAFANENGIKLTEFLPEYDKYGRGAPLKRNIQIIGYADLILAFWDGTSRGTAFVISKCKEKIKKCGCIKQKILDIMVLRMYDKYVKAMIRTVAFYNVFLKRARAAG